MGCIDITGNVTLHGNLDLQDDNDKIVLGAGNDLEIYSSGTIGHIKAANDDLRLETSRLSVLNRAATESLIEAYQDGAVELYHDNSKKFETKSNGVKVTGEVHADGLDVDGDADFDGNVRINRLSVYR